MNTCLAHGSTLISADGAVNNLDDDNYKVDYIIGDLDSLSDINLWENRGTQVMKIEEQDSTDFERRVLEPSRKPVATTLPLLARLAGLEQFTRWDLSPPESATRCCTLAGE